MNDKPKFPQKVQKELDAVQARGTKDSLAQQPPKPPKPKHLNDYHHRRQYVAAFIAEYCQGYADGIKQQNTSEPGALGYSEAVRSFQSGSSMVIFDAWMTNFGSGVLAALSGTKQVRIETPSEALAELCNDAAQQGIEWTNQCQEQIQQRSQDREPPAPDRDQDLGRGR